VKRFARDNKVLLALSADDFKIIIRTKSVAISASFSDSADAAPPGSAAL
jgi:hypothetical protein